MASPDVPAQPERSDGSPGTAWLIGLLFAVNALNLLDRQLPGILAQSIKADLHLSDTQLGLMGGVAFAVVYAGLGLPLARLADRWSAKWVLAGALAAWSVLTAAGAFAQSFLQLAVARVGVAAGEAGCTPAAHAMISARVAPHRRASAIAVYSLGVPAGAMCGLVLGGWLNDLHDWRFAMLAMGAPGLAVALLFALTVPRDGVAAPPAAATTGGLLDAARTLLSLRSYRHMFFAVTIFGVGVYANFQFYPAFLIRVHGLSAGQAGLVLGLMTGLIGGLGTFAGGWVGDRVARVSAGRMLVLPAAGFLLAAPCLLAGLLAPDLRVAVAFLCLPQAAHVMYQAPVYGTAQRLAPPGLKAMATAVLLFGLSLVGASVGPFVAGLASDLLQPRFGAGALRYALCLTAFTDVWAAAHLLLAARALPADLARFEAPDSNARLPSPRVGILSN
ncbi:MAG: MFS transporter [Caulobacterales bacterium]|nr:MFS transporter [Caulobacterales bacterium]